MRIPVLFGIALLSLIACKKGEDTPVAQAEPDEKYSGGINGTTFDFSQNAFGDEVDGLSNDEQGYFVVGNSFFRNNWTTAPGSVTSLDGLGPIFNAVSCGSCHFKDGRARPPLNPDEALNGLLFRLSIPGADVHGEPLSDPIYGGQLQDKAILNVWPEAGVRVEYQSVDGSFPDGETYSLRRPVYTFHDWSYGAMSSGWMFSPRIAPQNDGLGLLEIIPEADILSFADETDANGDGISGRPNYVWDIAAQKTVLGRFGWKANQPNLAQQAAGAFSGDMGITSDLVPQDHMSPAQLQQFPNLPNGGSPEIPADLFQQVLSYTRTLAVPGRRNHTDNEVLRGKLLFSEIHCDACHRPAMQTGNGGAIEALKNQKIRPYTDLLLHDMGPDLSDGRPDFLASGSEWRTSPLWGIGLIPTVNEHFYLMHDGRARGVQEAILWHGGEAGASAECYKKLSKADRAALIKFVESL